MSTAAAAQSTGGAPASTGGTPASTGAPASTGGASSTAGYSWTEGWRQHMAAGSTDPEKDLKQLERYESPEGIWKKARELERRMSSGELRTTLRKDATAQEIAAWRAENGIPAKPEEYKINLPAGRQMPKEDDPFVKAFLKRAHDSNMSQAHVDAAIAVFYEQVDQGVHAEQEKEAKLERETEDKLRQEWQGDYRVNKAMAEALLDRAPQGFKDRFLKGYLSDGTPIRADVASWKWLVQMEREINPASTVLPGSSGDLGKTIAGELDGLRKMMGDQNSEYWKGPKAEANQKRYRELIGAEQKMKAKAA
jgi:hypothetical protein